MVLGMARRVFYVLLEGPSSLECPVAAVEQITHCRRHIEELAIPVHVSVELYSVTDRRSATSGYDKRAILEWNDPNVEFIACFTPPRGVYAFSPFSPMLFETRICCSFVRPVMQLT